MKFRKKVIVYKRSIVLGAASKRFKEREELYKRFPRDNRYHKWHSRLWLKRDYKYIGRFRGNRAIISRATMKYLGPFIYNYAIGLNQMAYSLKQMQ